MLRSLFFVIAFMTNNINGHLVTTVHPLVNNGINLLLFYSTPNKKVKYGKTYFDKDYHAYQTSLTLFKSTYVEDEIEDKLNAMAQQFKSLKPSNTLLITAIPAVYLTHESFKSRIHDYLYHIENKFGIKPRIIPIKNPKRELPPLVLNKTESHSITTPDYEIIKWSIEGCAKSFEIIA